MAGRIRDEDLALVRERSPVDEVVGEYLQLRPAGADALKALCPFHDEKTPSFNVTPSRGLWYCFSCNVGGDVIKFVQRIDNLGFTEAVERLAARAGIELRYEQGGAVPGREHTERRRLTDAHRAAAEFYAERLSAPDAAPGRDFLASRGFAEPDWARFGVGYAPAEWDALTTHLRGRGFTDAELLRGGLASQGRRGPVDRFRGRLTWPIRDLTGGVVAFGARKLAADDDGPKYLNTPETPLFKKSGVLYGADLAKRDIAQRRQAVIVEGYTDVMACHLAGVTTAVATSGTSFGEGHVKILRRLLMDSDKFRGEVIFTFDGDAAGQRAVERAFKFEGDFVTQTMFTLQPDGLDPCDLRLKEGDAAVRDLIARRVPVYEFAIRSELARHNLDTNEGRLAALDAAAEIVGRIKDYGLRDRYAVSLDRWLGLMDEAFVLARVRARFGTGRTGRPGRTGRTPAGSGNGRVGAAPGGGNGREAGPAGSGNGRQAGPAGSGNGREAGPAGSGNGRQAGPAGSGNGRVGAPEGSANGRGGGPEPERLAGQDGPGERPPPEPESPYDSGDPVTRLEREALKLAVQRPALYGPAFDELDTDCFTVPAHAAVFGLISGCGGTGSAASGREWAQKLRAEAPDDRVRGFVTSLAVEPLHTPRADGEADARYADALLARVEELAVSREIAVLKSRLQRMSPAAESGYNRTFGDLVALEQRRKVLAERGSGAL